MVAQLSNNLSETGSDEVEVLVFQLNGDRYGVNLANVREILTGAGLTHLPQGHPAIRGVFKHHEQVVPLVDLRRFFKMPDAENEKHCRIIVVESNNDRLGFLVDHVERIHRLSWKSITDFPWTCIESDEAISSVMQVNDDMVLMPDFEYIAFRIAGFNDLNSAFPTKQNIDRAGVAILLANDSATMRRMLTKSLEDAKFGRLIVVNDGQAALDKLMEMADAGEAPDIVITDIEMPRMDGLHLTKRIKEDPRLKDLPVIVFSSLVSDDNLKKCKAVGATRQLTRPQLPSLVETVDDILCELTAV
ncbi:MAG: chemotaxis protein [Planctomycetota bacterium]